MSLLENLEEVQQNTKPSKKCIVARTLEDAKVSVEESAKVSELLWPSSDARRVPTAHLARALRKSGLAITDKSLERHRTQDCSCYR